jgi:hypothetical protein
MTKHMHTDARGRPCLQMDKYIRMHADARVLTTTHRETASVQVLVHVEVCVRVLCVLGVCFVDWSVSCAVHCILGGEILVSMRMQLWFVEFVQVGLSPHAQLTPRTPQPAAGAHQLSCQTDRHPWQPDRHLWQTDRYLVISCDH